jgi:hypothetical protein
VRIRTAIDELRTALRRLRWDDQDGYPGYHGNGRWDFVSTGLPVTPDELNALFELAGIVPDVIVPLGHCEDCLHAVNGRERGYVEPCGSCKRPRMSNFVPVAAAHRRRTP